MKFPNQYIALFSEGTMTWSVNPTNVLETCIEKLESKHQHIAITKIIYASADTEAIGVASISLSDLLKHSQRYERENNGSH